jgi:regulator of protease activity HflC (stomatin/prohibitin superfamily)
MVINADFSLSYTLIADHVPAFYVKFLTDKMDTFTDGFMRNIARDCLNENGGHYDIDHIMGDNAEFIAKSGQCIAAKLDIYGVHIEQFGLIGAPRPPPAVVDTINLRSAAQQLGIQKQNELIQVQADAAKQVAAAEGKAKAAIAEANGEAEANRIRTASITTVILENKRLDNQHDMIWRWNGVSPKVVSGGSGLMLQLPNDEK